MSETIIKDDIKLENIDEIKTENPEDIDFKKLNMVYILSLLQYFNKLMWERMQFSDLFT